MRTGRALPALDMQAQAIITAPMTKTKSFSSNFLLAEGCVTLLAGAFQFEMGMRFRRGHHEMDCFLFTVGLSLTECRKFVGTNRNNVWIVAADVQANDLTIFVTQEDRYIVAITSERDVRGRVTDRSSSEQQKYDNQVSHKPVKMV
jgi:hypothetical protein